MEPGNRAFASAAAELRGGLQVREMAGAVIGIVALHRSTLAGDHRSRATVTGPPISARESTRSGQRDGVRRSTCARAAGIGHASDGEGRTLGLERAGTQLGRIGLAKILQVERRNLAQLQEIPRRQTGERVFGRFASHRQAALGQRRQGFVGEVGRSDGRRAPAIEQTQADLLAFRPIEAFQLAEPDADARRAVADIEDVGRGRAGGEAALDQQFGNSAGGVGGLHRPRD